MHLFGHLLRLSNAELPAQCPDKLAADSDVLGMLQPGHHNLFDLANGGAVQGE